jgi:hypothetical protein
VTFLTAPREPYAHDRNRDQFKQPDANELFRQLRDDQPVTVSPMAAPSTSASPGQVKAAVTDPGRLLFALPAAAQGQAQPDPAPTFTGRTADQDVCADR